MNFTGRGKGGRKMFYGLLALLLLFCFLEYVFRISIPQSLFLAAAFLIAMLGDADEIIAMCICCTPLHNFFEFSFAVLFGSICYVIKYGDGMRLNYSCVPIALMVLWETLHCFGLNVNVMQYGGMCVPWILLAVLMSVTGHRFDYGFIVRAFTFTTAAMCCLLIGRILYVADFNIASALVNLQRLGMETEDLSVKVHPNSLGVLCVLGASGLMQLKLSGRGRKGDLFLSFIVLLFGVMTASKTFFFCLVFAVLLLFIAAEGKGHAKLRYAIGALAIGAMALLVSYLVMPDFLNYYVGRFFEKDFTTGRIDTMIIYDRFIASNLNVMLFGIGLQDFGNRLLRMCTEAVFVPHNSIHELVIAWGLPGVAIIAALWTAMILRSRRMCSRQRLIHYIPFLVILLKCQAGQMVTSPYTMLAFSLAYLSMCADLLPEDRKVKEPERLSEKSGVSLGRAMAALLRKWWLIALVSIVCATAAFGITKYAVTPMYESRALFYVNNRIQLDGELDHTSTDDIWVSRNLVDSCIVILNSRSFLNDVIEYADLDRTYLELKDMIYAGPVNETEIIEVIVTCADPVEAERIANGIAALLPERIQSIIAGTSTKVADYAVAASRPSSPGKIMNTALGFVFGFVLVVLLILLEEMSNRTIRRLEDIVQREEYPMLAVIPDLAQRENRLRPDDYNGRY